MSAPEPVPLATANADADSVVRGLMLMAAAMLMLPGLDAFAKALTQTLPAGQVAAARFVFQSLFLAPFALVALGRRILRPRRPWVHFFRGVLIAMATLMFFQALKYMPMADAIAIFFVEPLLLTLIAAVFLGEGIGWRRLTAVLVGFGGAMLVIRPSFVNLGWTAVLPAGAALCFAAYLALTRAQARGEDAFAMQFYAGLSGTLVMVIAIVAGSALGSTVLAAQWPTPWEWALMAALGLVATVGHLLVVAAFRQAPAGVLAPFQYLEIISATALGYWFFGDFPTSLTWLGVGIIVGSGIYVFWREQRLSARR